MKEKILKILLLLPAVLLAQTAPPADEPTVSIDNYTIPVLLFTVLVFYFVLKINTKNFINTKK
jgi:hypothetical protein